MFLVVNEVPPSLSHESGDAGGRKSANSLAEFASWRALERTTSRFLLFCSVGKAWMEETHILFHFVSKCWLCWNSAAIRYRIQLSEYHVQDDPLIAPCQCKGSIESSCHVWECGQCGQCCHQLGKTLSARSDRSARYVHLGCLRHWIRGRLNLSDRPLGSYFYRPEVCQVCRKGVGKDIEVSCWVLVIYLCHTFLSFQK